MNSFVSFIINACMLGVGLAMDAFSVSLANGLNDAKMKTGKMNLISGTFALFQFLMPMIGWVCVHTVVTYFEAFRAAVPWIDLILQGIATSIDALSVGFTIAEYGALQAFAASMIIGVVTYFICMAGLLIGRRAGTALSGKASIFGGVILIAIGIEIFFS